MIANAFDLWLINEPGQAEPYDADVLAEAQWEGYEGDDIEEAEEWLRGRAEARYPINLRGE